MKLYRRKSNHLMLVSFPESFELGGMLRIVPEGADLEPAYRIASGYYLDISQPPPAYNTSTHQLDNQMTWDEKAGTVTLTQVVVPLSLEALAWNLNAHSDQVAAAGKDYVERELNAAGQLMVDRILRKEPENALAVATDAWVENTYTEIETRKYLVRLGEWPDDADPCDFSLWTKKPYLIVQLKAEYDRLKALP